MVTLNEQHLRNATAILLQFVAIVDYRLAFGSGKSASRTIASIDFDRTQFATAVGCIAGLMAEMRNIDTGRSRGFYDSLAFLKRNVLAVDVKCASHVNPPLATNAQRHRRDAPCGGPLPTRHPDRIQVRN